MECLESRKFVTSIIKCWNFGSKCTILKSLEYLEFMQKVDY